jgi:hypothetical protein
MLSCHSILDLCVYWCCTHGASSGCVAKINIPWPWPSPCVVCVVCVVGLFSAIGGPRRKDTDDHGQCVTSMTVGLSMTLMDRLSGPLSRSRSRDIYFSNAFWRKMNNQSQPAFTQYPSADPTKGAGTTELSEDFSSGWRLCVLCVLSVRGGFISRSRGPLQKVSSTWLRERQNWSSALRHGTSRCHSAHNQKHARAPHYCGLIIFLVAERFSESRHTSAASHSTYWSKSGLHADERY